MDIEVYKHIRSGGTGFHEQERGLIAVWGREAVQFLDGMITNDVKTLGDGHQMLAAFPNAQGRLLAVVRVLRQGDRFLIETEEATREKVYQNLFRFTFAGDFFVEDLAEGYRFADVFDRNTDVPDGAITFNGLGFETIATPSDSWEAFISALVEAGGRVIPENVYEVLRIEAGIPKYGIDMDETTVVPELGLDGLISYNKGCYIGQEIIARIHFRGHVAKQLTGLISKGTVETGNELTSTEGKPAGRITSVAYSPKLEMTIALAYVRYDFLAVGTNLASGDVVLEVSSLPLIA
ncbi:YgfZ/GcvT domain-containing protein [Leptolyngbya sp. 7M]|uniref:CAF17-like 4Fe-4S cluster assembly/insertion protein YgfZ n=1 Tax=Leptolyngbya sp. 7M TaxID=2812896 RepID=UPI001B8D4449|nr:glycine cleavage T C-terminal barrel domain-containing protein [Leptolyngbya sp. 7M]QYO66295.1 hypothetical protein JVX88_05710 [Leptolyngbya sp. 7M]